jgi:hypothetical protein
MVIQTNAENRKNKNKMEKGIYVFATCCEIAVNASLLNKGCCNTF